MGCGTRIARLGTYPRPARAVVPLARWVHLNALHRIVAVALAHVFAVGRHRCCGLTPRSGGAVGDVSVDWIAVSAAAAVSRKIRARPYAVPLAGRVVPGVIAVLVRSAVGVRGASPKSGISTALVVGARRSTHPRPARTVVPIARLANCDTLRRIVAVALAHVFAVGRQRCYRCYSCCGLTPRSGGAVSDISVDRIGVSICTAGCRRTRARPYAVPLAGREVPGVIAVHVRSTVGVRGAGPESDTCTFRVVGARRSTHPRPARAVVPSARLANCGTQRRIVAVALAHVFAVGRHRCCGLTPRSGGAVGDVSVDWIAVSAAAAVSRKIRARPYAVPLAGRVVPGVIAVLVRSAVGVRGASIARARLSREVGAVGRTYPRPARAVDPSARLAHRGTLRLQVAAALAHVLAVGRRRCCIFTARGGGAVGDVSVDRIAVSAAAAVRRVTRARPYAVPLASREVPGVIAVLVRSAVGVRGTSGLCASGVDDRRNGGCREKQ